MDEDEVAPISVDKMSWARLISCDPAVNNTHACGITDHEARGDHVLIWVDAVMKQQRGRCWACEQERRRQVGINVDMVMLIRHIEG